MIHCTRDDVTQLGIGLVSLDAEQGHVGWIRLNVVEGAPHGPGQYGFVAHVMIGRQGQQTSVRVACRDAERGQQHADPYLS